MFCKKCHYPLVELDTDRCPECGRVFDRSDSRTFLDQPPNCGAWTQLLVTIAGVVSLAASFLYPPGRIGPSSQAPLRFYDIAGASTALLAVLLLVYASTKYKSVITGIIAGFSIFWAIIACGHFAQKLW
jgi:hypothetical protein